VNRCLLFWVLVLVLISCSPSRSSQKPTETAEVGENPTEVITQTPISQINWTTTPEPSPTVEPTPIPVFDICANIEDFRNCEVSEEELLDGTYFRWLRDMIAPTLVDEFKARAASGKMKTDVPMQKHTAGGAEIIAYHIKTAPNFPDPETTPFMREVTFGYSDSDWTFNDKNLIYSIRPVFYFDPETETVYPVITIKVGNYNDATTVAMSNDFYVNKMTYTPIFTSYTTASGNNDPIVEEVFKRFGEAEMADRMERFMQGDYAALSKEGIVVLGDSNGNESGWY